MLLEQYNLAAKKHGGRLFIACLLYQGSLFWLLEWSLNHITGLVRGVEHVLFGGEEIRGGGCGGEEFQEAPWVSHNLIHDGMEGLSYCWHH